MFSHVQLLKVAASFLALLVLVVGGCQRDSGSGTNADPLGKTKQVTVDVTGLT